MKMPLTVLFLTLHFIIAAQTSPTHAILNKSLVAYLEARNKIAPLNAAVTVAQGSDIISQQFFGISNLKTKASITASTSFLIASATKPFTATGIMLLQQKGKLSLSDPISKWIKGVPSTWGTVTLKHLLSHTSGLPDFISLKGGAALQPGLPHLLQLYKRIHPSFPPGTKFAYSNTNFILLSYVIEQCSGIKYEAFMQSHIFDPLQMEHTGFAYPKVPSTLAQAYRNVFSMNTLDKEELTNLAVLKGAGGMYSNSNDVVLFLNGFKKLLSKQAIDTMLQPVINDYALGWHVQNQFGKITVKHPGGINGFSTEMRFIPADSIAIVILSNIRSSDLNIRYAAFDMMSIINNKTPKAELDINPAYIGKYSLPEAYKSRFKTNFLELKNMEGRFVLSIPESSIRYLIPADKGRFFFYGEPVDVEFKEEGKLMRIISPSLGQIDCIKME